MKYFQGNILQKFECLGGTGIPLLILLLLVKFILFLNILQQFTCDRCLCTKSPLDSQPVVTGLQLTKWNKRTCETFFELLWRILEKGCIEWICTRAADWNLSAPDWTGRMRVMEKNQKVAKMNYSLFFILLNVKVKKI